MGKRFKDKVCAYCGGNAMTADHVIAREFFPSHLRDGLPKVPACARCNRSKSELEHYLITILPAGGMHPSAAAVLGKLGPRLAKNQRLSRELGARMRELPDGRATVPIRSASVDSYFRYVAKGLLFHHFKVVVGNGFKVVGSALQAGGAEALERMHQVYGDNLMRIERSYADGAFEYIGHIARQHIPVSVWQIRLYGRIEMGGAEDGRRLAAYEFGAAIFPVRPAPAWGAGWGWSNRPFTS